MEVMSETKQNLKFDKYFFIAPGSDYGKAMWNDLQDLENTILFNSALATQNKFLRFLHHFHFSFRINSKFQLPLQNIWEGMYSLDKISFEQNKKYCVIFTDISAGRTGTEYLKKLNNNKNIKMIIILVNTMASREKILKKRLEYFDTIFSFDKEDAKKYNFIYHPTNYSKIYKRDNSEIKTDVFFVGMSKGRQEILENIYKKLTDLGIKANFYISGVKNKKKLGIHYNKWLSYDKVLENIAETNCIIEVVEKKQTGITLRAMEAISFNKRLLTNNKTIKELPFYKTGYIQIFDNITDINIEFIRNRNPVDYMYNNEFSPINLIKRIEQIYREV